MKTTAFLFVFLLGLSFAQGFDFFYFVLQWPGSYCDSQHSCCYPLSGKPASDFGIHGLWPNNNDGSFPSNCDPNSPFDSSQISDLTNSLNANWPSLSCPSSNSESFWTHEWQKHGTCAESVFDEHGYFSAALDLKAKADVLQMLSSSGIEPNNNSYDLRSIKGAIQAGIGHEPGIECNKDRSGNSQLYQVYLCVDSSGSSFVSCPVLPSVSCSSQVVLPSF
ncbi:hypothetical protein HPP92_004330 [Vanilla planifolia]|uniref:Uncharacterized protein n=1 Tax=Vanilla planifolia TaxID=51239 RepID=A0A835RWN8_VANPL|nr:hypothetical protein HPP92_004330 [Vanilla planifolia]